MVVKRRRTGGTRFVLLVVVPLIALALGFAWWLSGGRYVTTDNSYVGAEKVLITPQVTGPVVAVHVIEGQKVKTGDPLFDIDPEPYRIALALSQGRLDAAKIAFANLRSSYASNEDQIRMGQDAVKVRQADFDRKNELATRTAPERTCDRDTSMAALIQARQILEFVRNQQATTMVKLGGSLDASIDNFPDYIQAKAGLEEAERNLRNTKILAPIDGVATQVAQIELGRVAPAGQPVFAVVADKGLWVDANPKELDMTFVRAGPACDGHDRRVPGQGMEAGRSARSRRARARSSRSCRRRTRAATGSRWSSACRCASASARTRTRATCAPA